MGKEKGKQSKLEKIKSFKEGCISQGKVFSPELDSGSYLPKPIINRLGLGFMYLYMEFNYVFISQNMIFFNSLT